MSKYLWIGLAGALGTLARYGLSGFIATRAVSVFPWGTLTVNVIGSFALGLLATLGIDAGLVPPQLRTAVATGFLGAFTTFSTWSLETLRLVESGSLLLAGMNVGGSVVAGLTGAWLGMVLGRLWG